MKLTKREFLKVIGWGSLSAVIPIGAIEGLYNDYRKYDFDPTQEHSAVVSFGFRDNRVDIEKLLKKSAQETLPPNVYYQIRESAPYDFGRNCRMAWYYSPKIEKKLNVLREPIYDPRGGYYYRGTFKTIAI